MSFIKKLPKGKKLLRNLKYYESYAKFIPELNRRETWEEACKDVMSMHYEKFPNLVEELDFVTEKYESSIILASQRNLQYRGPQIKRSNARLYNCCSTYIDRAEVFKQILFLLLNGCGVGYSVENRFIAKLPSIKKRSEKTITFVIEDSIEGWALALDALMMSFFNGSETIRFDGSNIRPEGSYISGGFKAPGYEPLKKSLELIENLLQSRLGNNEAAFLTSLDCHEVICFSADSVLSAGVRRSALICLFDKDDELMLNAKTGDWFVKKPHLARANNSVKLVKGKFTKEEFNLLKTKTKEFGEPGIVLVNDERFTTNPCGEIGFIPIDPITSQSCISFCNLNEINGGACKTKEIFFEACRAAAILGTLQASYTDFEFLGKATMNLVRLEALIGVSITGIMDNPQILLNPEILEEGAKIVKETNAEIAAKIGINPAARCTTIKPSGNASVLLGTSSGIHPAHAQQYFRLIQINKNNEIGKLLKETNPNMIEESVWSANNSDYVAYIPIEESSNVITKADISDIEFLQYVELVYKHWVVPGTNLELGYSNYITHNVSNTITVQDWDAVFDYIYEHQDAFCGLSFIPALGDKIYKQAPFTKVMSFDELVGTYQNAAIFASGLIVDSLHAFDNDLWDACESVLNRDFQLSGDRFKVLIKQDIIRRIKKFAKNYFGGNLELTCNCLKDVYLYHKWININRTFKSIDFETLELKQEYINVNTMGAQSCSGGACEITQI